MKSIFSFLIILQLIINGVNFAIAQSQQEDRHVCRGGDFKSSTIQKNRDSALDKLSALLKNSTYHGFHHVQAGDKSEEQVTATFLCPPHIHGQCEYCFRNLVPYLRKHCPKQNEVVAWDSYSYFNCMVRYSTGRKILSVLDDWAWYNSSFKNYVQAVELEKTLDSLTSKLKEKAAGGDALKKYAEGSQIYDGDELILYVAVQCTPDLSKEDCVKCLSKASVELRRGCCAGEKRFSLRVFSTNCNAWYSHLSFFDPPKKYHPEGCT